jgi:hypothetical protein
MSDEEEYASEEEYLDSLPDFKDNDCQDLSLDELEEVVEQIEENEYTAFKDRKQFFKSELRKKKVKHILDDD